MNQDQIKLITFLTIQVFIFEQIIKYSLSFFLKPSFIFLIPNFYYLPQFLECSLDFNSDGLEGHAM